MSKNTSKAKKDENLASRAGSLAHELFLANLGLCGKLYEQSQEVYQQATDRYRKVYNNRGKIFNQLVKRGEKVQKDAVNQFERIKEERKVALEQRWTQARERLDLIRRDVQKPPRGTSQSKAA
jgi:hypothetical protein